MVQEISQILEDLTKVDKTDIKTEETTSVGMVCFENVVDMFCLSHWHIFSLSWLLATFSFVAFYMCVFITNSH